MSVTITRLPTQSRLEPQWIEFFKQKISRDAVIDLSIKLTNAEKSIDEAKLVKKNEQSEISHKKEIFTRWATLYFHSISLTKTMLESERFESMTSKTP